MPFSNATVHVSAARTRLSDLLPFLLTPTDADKNHIITHICIYIIHRLSIISWKSRSSMDWNQPMATHIHALYWMRNTICYRSIQSLFKHMCDSHSTKAARRLCANMITYFHMCCHRWQVTARVCRAPGQDGPTSQDRSECKVCCLNLLHTLQPVLVSRAVTARVWKTPSHDSTDLSDVVFVCWQVGTTWHHLQPL